MAEGDAAEPAPGDKPPERPLFKLGLIEKQYFRPQEWDWTVFKQHAPQALLRDLHRPVKVFTLAPWQRERIDFRVDGGRSYWREERAEYWVRRAVDVASLLHTHKDFVEAVAEHRGTLQQSWPKALKVIQEARAKAEEAGWEPQAWVPKEQRDQPPAPPAPPLPQKSLRFLK